MLERVQQMIDETYVNFKFQWHAVRQLSAKVPIEFSVSHFTVKTANTRDEINAVLRLRYEVFLREGLEKTSPIRIDFDRYDTFCDHLIIKDRRTQHVIATYRLISSLYAKDFYSQNEFDLSYFLSLPGNKLELGRACIHPSHRNGVVLALLWRGISQYLQATQSKYLFGCGSVKMTDPLQIAELTEAIRAETFYTDEFKIKPTLKFRAPAVDFSQSDGTEAPMKVAGAIPSLIHGYIRAGAKICGAPAYDRDFKCIDLLTVLDTAQMSNRYDKKYGI